ncbi:scavenger receptor class F member 1-like [Argopecten irradians]|uniref:scavenger receptor class F member 1-like n=1 Tax=Argopecten irradians TaxID=31199 RepID=UPI00371E1EA9
MLLLECDIGYHGNHCDQPCPDNCKNKICNMDSGSCEACEPGYHGDSCNEAVQCASDTSSEQSTEKQNEAVLDAKTATIIAVFGTLLGISICCNIGFVVFYLRHF